MALFIGNSEAEPMIEMYKNMSEDDIMLTFGALVHELREGNDYESKKVATLALMYLAPILPEVYGVDVEEIMESDYAERITEDGESFQNAIVEMIERFLDHRNSD